MSDNNDWVFVESVEEIPEGTWNVFLASGHDNIHSCTVLKNIHGCKIVTIGHFFSYDCSQVIAYKPIKPISGKDVFVDYFLNYDVKIKVWLDYLGYVQNKTKCFRSEQKLKLFASEWYVSKDGESDPIKRFEPFGDVVVLESDELRFNFLIDGNLVFEYSIERGKSISLMMCVDNIKLLIDKI